ncbi:MAG: tetratricopeptide repeat protein [bacterium]|nr:tetratricopeptide repeat protein [bacterium]
MTHRKFTITLITLFLAVGYFQFPQSCNKDTELPPIKLNAEAVQFLEGEQWSEALEALTEITEQGSHDEKIKYYQVLCCRHLAQAAFKKRKFNDAVRHLENGLLYNNEDPILQLEMGYCYFQLSNYSRAEDAFNEVIAQCPENAPALRKLGEIYYLDNQLDKAETHWEQALALNPGDARLKKRLENLKKQLKLNAGLDTEMGMIFSVSFDGEKNPGLSEHVTNVLEEVYQDIGYNLNLYPRRQIPVLLLTKKAFFDITDSPQWAGGLYEGHIKIPMENYNPGILKSVLRHEYVHAVLYDQLSNRCPWWLNEGLAQYFSGDTVTNTRRLKLARQVLADQGAISPASLPGSIKDDKEKAGRAYALALSAVDYFVENFNVIQLQAILELMGEGQTFDSALRELTTYSFNEFENNWYEDATQ